MINISILPQCACSYLVHRDSTIGDKEDWDQYVERLVFTANGITGADKKRSVFSDRRQGLQAIAQSHAPVKPGETSYEDLTTAMKRHLTLASSEIVRHFKFNR